MSLVLNVEILGEFKKLTQATTGAQDSLGDMNKRAQSVSKSIGKAFAAIGIGLSFKMIANELQEASKAAIEDAKSQALLANALKNTLNVTDDTIAATEEIIRQYQFSASVADDELRPAYQKLALATKDTTRANELLGVALDVAAGTGKSLDVVSQAMARSLAGSDTALLRLIPSLKGSKQPMEDLANAFAGAAEKAADTDPYKRMNIVFGELQEQVGMALLPSLEKFSSWVASPEGQEKLNAFVTLITGLAGKFDILAGFIVDNADAFIQWSGVIVGVGIAIKVFTTALGIYSTLASVVATRNAAIAASQVAIGTTAGAAAVKVGALGAALRLAAGIIGVASLVLLLGGDAAKVPESDQLRDNEGRIIPTKRNAPLTIPQPPKPTGAQGYNFQTGTINNTINVVEPNATASDIIKKLDDYYKATGARLTQ
jgi:hypothetical protein